MSLYYQKNNSTIDSIIDNIEMMRDNRKIALLFSRRIGFCINFHTLKESGNKLLRLSFFFWWIWWQWKYFAKEYCSKYGVDFISVNKNINFNEKLYFNLNPNSRTKSLWYLNRQMKKVKVSPHRRWFIISMWSRWRSYFRTKSFELFGIDAYRSHGLMFYA